MGVNYRHAYHAGNPADVFKHTLLVLLARALQRKEAGFLFVDTHAGRGRYDLALAAQGDTRPREPEWPAGIGRLWGLEGVEAGVADYLSLARAFDRRCGNLGPAPRFYPGSPRLARAVARAQDRLELWERRPDEAAALEAEFRGERRVSVHAADGYQAPRACLPPRERRALVLIDPPFEAPGEWADVAGALSEGLRRLPSGTFAAWYPLTGRAGAEGLLGSARGLAAPSLTAEIVVDPRAGGMRGCGLLVVNPPWKFDGQAESAAGYLASALSPDREALSSVRWIVSE
jgi:23S rRNA (adenine2030-N6)-methyltransferase